MRYEEMLEAAKRVSKNSYSPYSKFPVGACVLTENDNIYTGCNFENSSLGLTICAERNAVGSAIADGERKIKAIAIYSPNMQKCTPCGACRQVLNEFKSDKGIDIIVEVSDGLLVYTLDELLPESFGL
ncbi:cytidine deaminase [bacterium]|nr:cytidine deaminase [bacterium]